MSSRATNTPRAARATSTPRPVRTNTRPALNNGFNTAYGSRGVAHLGAQIATGRAEEAHIHFQTQRTTRSQSSRVEPVPAAPSPVREASSPEVERPHTAQDLNAGYDSLTHVQEATRSRSPSAVPSSSAYEEPARDPDPSKFDVFVHFLPRFLPQLFRDLEQTTFEMLKSLAITLFLISSIIITMMTIICWIPLPESVASPRNQFYHGLKVSFGGAEPLYDWKNHETFVKDGLNLTQLHFVDRNEMDNNFMSRTELEATLAANNQMHMDDLRKDRSDFRNELNYFEERVLSAARMMAGVHQVGSRISTGAFASMVENAHRVLHEVNYFSLGNGAIIDPKLTSKTANPNKGWIPWAYMHMMMTSAPLNPPITALMAWQEGTECWCAEHSTGSMAKGQLAVSMPQKIAPHSIVIEHIPPQGTNDIGAAPWLFAVWAQVTDEAEAQAMQAAITDEHWHYSDKTPEERCGDAPTYEGNWVCIHAGNFMTLPSNENMVQKFDMHGALEAGIVTDKIVFRVMENWGADHTCIYRIRVTADKPIIRSEAIQPGQDRLADREM